MNKSYMLLGLLAPFATQIAHAAKKAKPNTDPNRPNVIISLPTTLATVTWDVMELRMLRLLM